MNGNVTFVGLNFQERVEEEHLKKEGNNGKVYYGIGARYLLGAIVPVFSTLLLRLKTILCAQSDYLVCQVSLEFARASFLFSSYICIILC